MDLFYSSIVVGGALGVCTFGDMVYFYIKTGWQTGCFLLMPTRYH